MSEALLNRCMRAVAAYDSQVEWFADGRDRLHAWQVSAQVMRNFDETWIEWCREQWRRSPILFGGSDEDPYFFPWRSRCDEMTDSLNELVGAAQRSEWYATGSEGYYGHSWAYRYGTLSLYCKHLTGLLWYCNGPDTWRAFVAATLHCNIADVPKVPDPDSEELATAPEKIREEC